MNVALKDEINRLANLLYKLQGYTRPPDFKFFEATHPQEKLAWNQAVVAYVFLNKSDTDLLKEQI